MIRNLRSFNSSPSDSQIHLVAILAMLLVGWHSLSPATASGQQKPDVEQDARYGALTWVQNSAEYAVLTEQTYRLALAQLLAGIQDRNWSGDEVQSSQGGFENKPVAIILDCDETVLDNSAYNARNILDGSAYSTDSWNQWCQEGIADAVPGALEFVKRAEGLGVKIFYITNRRDVVKTATVKNLRSLGFPADDSTVLTRNDDLGRGDDKISRRSSVANDYRIVLLIGDSMSDLCSGMDVPNTKRRNEVAAAKTNLLGTRWIMLPNPVYGSWQRALPNDKQALKPKRPASDNRDHQGESVR